MLVRKRMTKDLVTVSPKETLARARELLRKRRINHLPVVESGNLVGIVTDRDLRSAPDSTAAVGEIMARKLIVVPPDSMVDEAARVLRQHRIGALPVVEKGKLVGILTAADILDAFVDLSGVGEPTYLLVVCAARGKSAETQVRDLIQRRHGEIRWMQRDGGSAGRLHVRVKTQNVDDIVCALEAEGIAVDTVVGARAGRSR